MEAGAYLKMNHVQLDHPLGVPVPPRVRTGKSEGDRDVEYPSKAIITSDPGFIVDRSKLIVEYPNMGHHLVLDFNNVSIDLNDYDLLDKLLRGVLAQVLWIFRWIITFW